MTSASVFFCCGISPKILQDKIQGGRRREGICGQGGVNGPFRSKISPITDNMIFIVSCNNSLILEMLKSSIKKTI